MNVLHTVGSVLTSPGKFFTDLRKEKGIRNALRYSIVMAAFYLAMSFIISGLTLLAFGSFPEVSYFFAGLSAPLLVLVVLLLFLVTFLLVIGLFFLCAAILHVWLMLFGARVPFEKTFQLYVYSRTPRMLFGWIPVVKYLSTIYTLVLMVIGVQRTHNLSLGRALVAVLLPVALFLIVFVIIWIVVFASLIAAPY